MVKIFIIDPIDYFDQVDQVYHEKHVSLVDCADHMTSILTFLI